MKRITVDEDRCIGSGVCEMLADTVVEVDEDSGMAQVLGDGLVDDAKAAELVERCPTQAIAAVDA